jgi:hypothetical protein
MKRFIKHSPFSSPSYQKFLKNHGEFFLKIDEDKLFHRWINFLTRKRFITHSTFSPLRISIIIHSGIAILVMLKAMPPFSRTQGQMMG